MALSAELQELKDEIVSELKAHVDARLQAVIQQALMPLARDQGRLYRRVDAALHGAGQTQQQQEPEQGAEPSGDAFFSSLGTMMQDAMRRSPAPTTSNQPARRRRQTNDEQSE